MKEATGELNMTVVTVIAIVAIAALLYTFWPQISNMIQSAIGSNTQCRDANGNVVSCD